ncbi:hypothetical protein HN924_01200 [Candidatus Woesearchaeota archaeon]|jgi:hypothetical protein|nr:hypothetical protein [Candidatus Woesearchaeota archaeon]MBT7062565.1 hypothetical protein [Candidatus Woesearchaeota archaeon]MBT7402358.1 hypothetical protein [Candidatus Woesearchaeota archaeon]
MTLSEVKNSVQETIFLKDRIKTSLEKIIKLNKEIDPGDDGYKRFVNAKSDDIMPYVQSNWTDLDEASLVNDSQVILFGDTNHAKTGNIGGMAKYIPLLKKAGITDVAIEFPRDEKNLEAVTQFNETGDLSLIRPIANQTRTPVRIVRFFRNAHQEGMNVSLIDMPEKSRDSKWSTTQLNYQRGIYMGQVLSELAEDSNVKIAAFCGAGHFREKEIPKQLTDDNIAFKKFAVVTQGQPMSFILPDNQYEIGPANAVNRCDLSNRSGFVDLNNNYDLDGFIYFTKSSLIEDQKSAKLILDDISSIIPSVDAPKENALAHLTGSTAIQTISQHFGNRVDPSLYTWEGTNTEKIYDFVNNIDSLNNGQKLHLSIMLENYVRTTLRHGGGSILRMEFDSDANAFGIDTIDTFGKKFDAEEYAAARGKHREVTLDMLLSQYNFEDIMIKDVSQIPETDILPNPENLESAHKVMILMSAYATHPERITWANDRSTPMIGVYREGNHNDDYITRLGIEDFLLTDMESKLVDFEKKNSEYTHNMDKLNTLFYSFSKDKALSFSYRKKVKNYSSEFIAIFSDIIYASNNVTRKIINARSELQYLSNDSAETLIENAYNKLETYNAVINNVADVMDKKNVYRGKFFENDLDFKQIIQDNREMVKDLRSNLNDIRTSLN